MCSVVVLAVNKPLVGFPTLTLEGNCDMSKIGRYLALVAGACLMLSMTPAVAMAQDAVLPDLVVKSISLTTGNKIQVTFANVGKGPLPLLWSSTADVHVDDVKKGAIWIAEAPSYSTGGGIAYPGGTSTFLTAWTAVPPISVTVIVDPLKNIIESNEQNNSQAVHFNAPVTLPDLIVQTIDTGEGNRLSVAFANVGEGPLPAGWQAVADVFFGQTKPGSIRLGDVAASTYGGGISSPGGVSVFLTDWEVTSSVTVAVTVDALSGVAESNEDNNTMTAQLTPANRLPDLVVESTGVGAGNKLSITVGNWGHTVLPKGWTATVDVMINQVKVGSANLNNPPSSSTGGGIESPGGTSTFLTAWQITVPTTVTVIVDPLNSVTELDEQNNSSTTLVAPAAAIGRLPDLIVSGITTTAGNRLAILVMNAGEAPLPDASAGIANVFVNRERIGFFDLGIPSESFFGGIGAPGGFSSYLLDYTISAEADVLISVDATNTVAEGIERNNSLTRRLLPPDQPQEPLAGRHRSASFQIGSTGYLIDGGRGTMDVTPMIIEDRTFMPVRFVAEPLGATVLWDEEHRKVTVVHGLKSIELWIASNTARINGTPVFIDPHNPKVVPLIHSSRTYLPLRFVSEVLGAKVTWVADTRTILLDFEPEMHEDGWKSTDINGTVVIDDEAVWQHFRKDLINIDGIFSMMKDGRKMELAKVENDPAYVPRPVIDPDPPSATVK